MKGRLATLTGSTSCKKIRTPNQICSAPIKFVVVSLNQGLPFVQALANFETIFMTILLPNI
jgi:hypothetical protein